MKAVIKIVILIFALVAGVLYFFLSPVLNMTYAPEEKWGMEIMRPSLVPKIDDSSDIYRYSGANYKFYFNSRSIEGFDPSKIFNNYQITEDFANGQYFFYCRNKKTYSAAWVQKDDRVFIVQYSANSNMSDWIDISIKTIKPSARGVDDEWVNKLRSRIAKKYRMISMKTLVMIIGGVFIGVLLLVIFLTSISGRRPSAVMEIESEGIIWERKSVPASFKTSMNYNISAVYVVMTGSYLRIYSMGREIIRIPSNELMNHINGDKAVFKYGNVKVEIKSRYLQDHTGSANY